MRAMNRTRPESRKNTRPKNSRPGNRIGTAAFLLSVLIILALPAGAQTPPGKGDPDQKPPATSEPQEHKGPAGGVEPSRTGSEPKPGSHEKPSGLVTPFRPEPEPEPQPTPAPTPVPTPVPSPTPTPPGAPAISPVPGTPSSSIPTTRSGTTRTPSLDPSSVRRRGRTRAISLENWESCWRFNRDAFTIRKKIGEKKEQVSRDAGIFLGRRSSRAPEKNAKVNGDHIRNQVIPPLLKALEDRNPSVRADACIALGKVGFSEHVPILITRLRDSAGAVREAAVLGMGLLGRKEAIPSLLAILKANDTGKSLRGGRKPEIRMRTIAALSLGLIGKDDTGDSVRKALTYLSSHRSTSREMALAATIGLGIMQGNTRDLDEIASHLKSLAVRRQAYDDQVRAQAVTGIGRLHARDSMKPDSRTLTGLARLMIHDRVSHVRRSAVSTLGFLVREPGQREAAARAISIQRVKGKGFHTRNLAAVSLGLLGGNPAYRSLCNGIRNSSSETHRAYCALGLGILIRNVKESVPSGKTYDLSRGLGCLRKAFDRERSLSLKSCLALALGLARDAASGPRLLKAFRKTGEQSFRGYCGLALGMVKHEAAVPDLMQVLEGGEYLPSVKRNVAMGLGIIGPRNLASLLAILKKSRSAYALTAVIHAAGRVGDTATLKPLAALATDRRAQTMVRSAAIKALGTLGDPRPVPALASLRAHHNYLACDEAVNHILTRDL